MDKLFLYFTRYAFVRHAAIVGVLVALCASLLGVILVLKRFSYIGDGLSHMAFGAMAVATVANVSNNLLVVLPITLVAAILLLRMGQSAKVKGDAVLAMLSVGALAVGYLLLNVFSSSANVAGDVCATLFGSTRFLTLSQRDVWTCIVLAVIVILLYLIFYHKIFAVTFDEGFTGGSGVRVKLYNLLIATITAVVIVLAMRLVGSLLITALIIFPALSAMRLFSSFRAVTICSAVFAVLSSFLGICLAILCDTPVGATIVAVDIVGFLGCSLAGKVLGR